MGNGTGNIVRPKFFGYTVYMLNTLGTIFICLGVGSLCASSLIAHLAASWTENRGLRAFAWFIAGLVGLGLTLLIPQNGSRTAHSVTSLISYMIENSCIFLMPFLVFGIFEKKIPRTFLVANGALCGAGFILKTAVALVYLTQWAQSTIAVFDTLLILSYLLYFARNLGAVKNALTRRMLGRFIAVTIVFMPILLVFVIGFPGFAPPGGKYVMTFYNVALSIVVVAEARDWLREIVLADVRPEAGPTAAEPAELSGRQKEIAKLILEGKSAKEIAAELGISPKTAENHTYALYRKLGARSRLQFYALMNGKAPAAGETAYSSSSQS
jgi:DNA-binding CsgD family transcriptional regulator